MFKVYLNKPDNPTCHLASCEKPYDFTRGYACSKGVSVNYMKHGDRSIIQVGQQLLYFIKLKR